MKKIIPLIIVFLFSYCHKPAEKSAKTFLAADTLTLSYAQGFKVQYFVDYKQVTVLNPWADNKVMKRYYLVKNKNTKTPNDGVKIKIPLQRLAVTSVTVFEFLSLIDEISSITAVCSPHLIYNQHIREKQGRGEAADLGDSFSLNIEKLLQIAPDALLASGYGSDDIYTKRIEKMSIPVLLNNEWMESTPLARTEWLKFIAVFFDKENEADSIFNYIVNHYNSIIYRANASGEKPKIMFGNDFRGTWYMAGGQNYMARLFVDAGADYYFADNAERGSLPLNYETVIKNFAESDYWFNCNYNSLAELVQADKKNAYFRPVKLGRVYNFNKRLLPSGANDFWESAVARPDLLLQDVISVLQPDSFPNYETVYLEKLK